MRQNTEPAHDSKSSATRERHATDFEEPFALVTDFYKISAGSLNIGGVRGCSCAIFTQVCEVPAGLRTEFGTYLRTQNGVCGWMDELGVWKVLAQPSSSLAGKMSHVQNVDPALKFYK